MKWIEIDGDRAIELHRGAVPGGDGEGAARRPRGAQGHRNPGGDGGRAGPLRRGSGRGVDVVLAAVAVVGGLFVVSQAGMNLWTTPIGEILGGSSPASPSQSAPPPSGDAAASMPASVPLPEPQADPASGGPLVFSGGKTAPVERDLSSVQPLTTTAPVAQLQAGVILGTEAPAPVPAASAGTSQLGEIVNDGIEAPALRLTLGPDLVSRLVKAGMAMVIARSDNAARYLLAADGRFVKATVERVATLSSRAFEITDPRLQAGWSLDLRREDPSHVFTFDLRFTNGVDADILSQQVAALATQNIDMAAAKAAGQTIATDGAFDDTTMVFRIDHVSVEQGTGP